MDGWWIERSIVFIITIWRCNKDWLLNHSAIFCLTFHTITHPCSEQKMQGLWKQQRWSHMLKADGICTVFTVAAAHNQSEEEGVGRKSTRGEKHKRATRSRQERYFLLPFSATVIKQEHIYELLHLIMFAHLWCHFIPVPLPGGILIATIHRKEKEGHSLFWLKLARPAFIPIPLSAFQKF